MNLRDLTELGLAITAIAGGVGGIGFLWRRLRGGMKLADLLTTLPARLDSLDEAVAGLHNRMKTAEAAHDDTLVAIEAVDAKVDSLDGKVGEHLSWSQGEMTRRTEAEAQLWEALKARPEGT